MNTKSICKILIILMLINFLNGCSFIKDLAKDNKAKEDEMNIGNSKNIMIKNENIYFIDTSNENKLYVIDSQFKNKKLISDKYFLRIVAITDKEIYFIQKTMLDERIPLYELCSIDLKGDSYEVIVDDENVGEFLKNKTYYYKVTDEKLEDPGMVTNYSNFYAFDINSNQESIIDKRAVIYRDRSEVYKDKIYYDGPEYKFLEYDPDTGEKNK